MSKNANELLALSRQYLGTIFGNVSLIATLKSDPHFAETVAKGIAAHAGLERMENAQVRLTEKYVSDFKRHTGKDPDLQRYEAAEDLDDILDQINYLNVAVKNLFEQKELPSFELDYRGDSAVEPAAPKKAAAPADSDVTDVEPLHGTPLRGSASASGQTAAPPPAGAQAGQQFRPFVGFATPESLEVQYRIAAGQKIDFEVITGKIYRWKEKPRIIYLLQYVALAAGILFALSALAVVIGWIVASSNGVLYFDTNGASSPLNGTLTLSFVIIPVMFVIFALLVSNSYLNSSAGRISRSKRAKLTQFYTPMFGQFQFPDSNANIRYHFDSRPINYLCFGYIVFTLIPFIGASPLTVIISIDQFGTSGATGTINPYVMATYVLNIVFLASFAPLFFTGIAGSALNSKPDTERLEQILNEYVEEIKRSGPVNGTMSPGSYPPGWY